VQTVGLLSINTEVTKRDFGLSTPTQVPRPNVIPGYALLVSRRSHV
jgi:hypothetical protein